MPFATEIITDNRLGVKNLSEQAPCKNLEQAMTAVRRLNGKQYTEVILIGNNRDLAISGGNDGRYIAFVSVGQDEEFYNLVNPSTDSSTEVAVVAGGQLGTFPQRQVVSLDTALIALKEFYETGQLSPSLTWGRQS